MFIFSQFWQMKILDQGVGRFGFFWGLSLSPTGGRLQAWSSHGVWAALGPLCISKFMVHQDTRLEEEEGKQMGLIREQSIPQSGHQIPISHLSYSWNLLTLPPQIQCVCSPGDVQSFL